MNNDNPVAGAYGQGQRPAITIGGNLPSPVPSPHPYSVTGFLPYRAHIVQTELRGRPAPWDLALYCRTLYFRTSKINGISTRL